MLKIILILIIAFIFIIVIPYILGGKEKRKLFEKARVCEKDFSTPEGAILCLEEAYIQRDLEKAVKCKDFMAEARMMLKNLGKEELIDGEILGKTAETLELSFRKEYELSPPAFTGIETRFLEREAYDDNIVVVNEILKYPNGMVFMQKILSVKTDFGWRVLIPIKSLQRKK